MELTLGFYYDITSKWAISASDINIELGNASNATLSFNDSTPRTLTKVASGIHNASDFYGKQRLFGALYSTGNNTYDAGGTGSTTGLFTNVSSTIPWLQVIVGQRNSLGIKLDGTLWGWGKFGL